MYSVRKSKSKVVRFLEKTEGSLFYYHFDRQSVQEGKLFGQSDVNFVQNATFAGSLFVGTLLYDLWNISEPEMKI